MYVVWDTDDDSAEGMCFVSNDLREAHEYAADTFWMGGELRVFLMVEVPMPEAPPVQGCTEPPGHRFTCPRCSQTEFKEPFAEWQRFRPLQVQIGAAPRGPGLVCRRCETLFRVEFY